MIRLLHILTALALAVVILLGLVLTVCVMELRAFCADLQVPVTTTLRDTHLAVLEAGLTARNLREASGEWKRASAAQAVAATQAGLQVRIDLEHLNGLIEATDRNLNGDAGLLPTVNGTILAGGANFNGLTAQLSGEMEGMAADARASLQASTEALQHLSHDLDLPQLPAAVENISLTAEHVNGIAANGEIASQLALKRFREAMRPQKLIVTLLERLFGLAGQGAEVYYYTVR